MQSTHAIRSSDLHIQIWRGLQEVIRFVKSNLGEGVGVLLGLTCLMAQHWVATCFSSKPTGPHLLNMAFFLLAVGLLLLAGAESAPNIMKRSDDADPLTAVVQQLSAKIADLQARQSADEARLSKYWISSVLGQEMPALKIHCPAEWNVSDNSSCT